MRSKNKILEIKQYPKFLTLFINISNGDYANGLIYKILPYRITVSKIADFLKQMETLKLIVRKKDGKLIKKIYLTPKGKEMQDHLIQYASFVKND